MNKILLLYSYCEIGNNSELRKQNLNFFLKNGLLDNVDYKFIISGHKLNILIPNTKNIEIIYRDNKGLDFGAYSEVLLNLNYDNYDYFFFVNDSVRGPFLCTWFPLRDC